MAAIVHLLYHMPCLEKFKLEMILDREMQKLGLS
jgi:hypothetical protein